MLPLLLAAAACSDTEEPVAPLASASRLALAISDGASAPGATVAVTVRLDPAGGIGAIQGWIRFDPQALRYLGQGTPTRPAVLVGDAEATAGGIKFAAVDPAGLPSRLGPFYFEVRRPEFGASLRLVPEILASTAGAPVRGWPASIGPSELWNPEAGGTPRLLRLADWIVAFGGDTAIVAPQLLPGDGTVFGDVNLNGAVNVFDVLAVQNAAAGNLSILAGLTTDFVAAGNVAPANAPGIGEAADPVPPGIEADGTRNINVFDALSIANYAAGNGDLVAGQPIPGLSPTVRVVLAGVLTADRTLARDTIYELDGTVIVPSGVTLTIEAGTRIEGSAATRGHLSIRRGAMIQALGTRYEPIVFTCTGAAPTAGCWGGISINGSALLNNPPVLGCPSKTEPSGGTYGGCLVAHSSGGLRFARIEFAGAPWPGGGAAAGLALNGVGSGTFLEDVQIHRSGADAVVISGGRAQLREVVISHPAEDGIDWDDGWQGKIQALVVLRSTGTGSALRGSNAASDPLAGPRSHPTIYNASVVALNPPGTVTAPAFHFRRGTGVVLRDVIVQGWSGTGLEIDDNATCARISADSLDVSSGIFFGNAANYSTDADCVDEVAFATDPIRANDALDPLLIDPTFLLSPDLRPNGGSPAGTAVTPPADGFFDPTRIFRGAVPLAGATRANIPWYAGWIATN